MTRKILEMFLIFIFFVSLFGCRSINVGGSGTIGDVHGSGSVHVPIPSPGK